MKFQRAQLLIPSLLLLFAPLVHAGVPQTVNFQGYLKHGDGTPVVSNISTVFSLYDAPTGGNVVWSETQSITPLNGVFQVELGKFQPLGAGMLANPVYLGVQVGSDPELTPRQILTSVPYALRAAVVDSLASGAVTTAALADGSVSSAKLDTAYVKRGGDTMTGTLALPANGLTVGTTQLVANGGNVGIGTATPDSRLTVAGGGWDLTNSEGDFKIGNGTYRLKMGIATGGGGAGDAFIRAHGGTGRMILGSGTGNVLTVTGNKVGINTITPSATLTVGAPLIGSALSGTLVTNSGALGAATGDTLKLGNFGFTAGGNSVSLGLKALRTSNSTDWNGSAIGFFYDVDNTSPVNNAQFWLTSDGRVGVGTSAPTKTLDVNGIARIRNGLEIGSTNMVTNLNAEMIGGQKLADLDQRYGKVIEARYRYAYPNVIPNIPFCNLVGDCPISAVHVDLPAGNFVITFGVWLSNTDPSIWDDTRTVQCWPTGAGPYALDGINLKLADNDSHTASWTTTRSGPARINVYCAVNSGGTTGASSGVVVYEAKITAIKVGAVERQDGP